MFTYCPPYLLATVFGDAAKRTWSLNFLCDLDKGLQAAVRLEEATADETLGAALKTLLKDVWWRATPLSLEMLQTARNSNFQVDQELRDLCFSLYGGPSNTKLTAEDVFAHRTHIAARSQKGQLRMSRWAKWFYMTTCQNALRNGYRHVTPEVGDYQATRVQRAGRCGLYFGATEKPPESLKLATTQQAYVAVNSVHLPKTFLAFYSVLGCAFGLLTS